MWLLQKELIRAIWLRNKDPTFCVSVVRLFELEKALEHRFLSLKKNRIKKFNQTNQVLYVSAVSLKLAKVYGQSASEVAKTLANSLSASIAAVVPEANPLNLGVLDSVWRQFKVQTAPPGWLHLNLSDKGLGQWLQLLNDVPPQAIEAVSQRSNHPSLTKSEQNSAGPLDDFSGSGSLFPIQHAHARCCSMLRLAHRENLITLQDPEPEDLLSPWRIIQPHPLPWLDRSGHLCLTQPVEHQLIHQLVEAVDHWTHCQPRLNRQPLLAQSQRLSKAFQAFHRSYPLWGEVKTLPPSLIQARLGLISVTQLVLQLLLSRGLGVSHPLHL